MVTSFKRTCATRCTSQSAVARACLHTAGHGRLMPPQETLKHPKAGLTQSLVEVSALSLSPGVHKIFLVPSKQLWWERGLILNVIAPLLLSCCGFSFALGHGVSFCGGFQNYPVNHCSTASCNFGVLTEDESTFLYSTILHFMY